MGVLLRDDVILEDGVEVARLDAGTSTDTYVDLYGVTWTLVGAQVVGGLVADIAMSGSGVRPSESYDGTGSLSLDIALSGAGEVVAPSKSGTGDLIADVTLAGAGEVVSPSLSGSGSLTLDVALAGAGEIVAPSLSGSGDLTADVVLAGAGEMPAQTGSASGALSASITLTGAGQILGGTNEGSGSLTADASLTGAGIRRSFSVTGSVWNLTGLTAEGGTLDGTEVVTQQPVGMDLAWDGAKWTWGTTPPPTGLSIEVLPYPQVDDRTQQASGSWTISLGDEDPTRHIVIVAQGTYITYPATYSGTLAGVPLQYLTQPLSGADWDPESSGILMAKVPTGTTGQLVLNNTNDWNNMSIGVFRITGADHVLLGANSVNAAQFLPAPIPTYDGGVLIAALGLQGGGNPNPVWDPATVTTAWSVGYGYNAGSRAAGYLDGLTDGSMDLSYTTGVSGRRTLNVVSLKETSAYVATARDLGATFIQDGEDDVIGGLTIGSGSYSLPGDDVDGVKWLSLDTGPTQWSVPDFPTGGAFTLVALQRHGSDLTAYSRSTFIEAGSNDFIAELESRSRNTGNVRQRANLGESIGTGAPGQDMTNAYGQVWLWAIVADTATTGSLKVYSPLQLQWYDLPFGTGGIDYIQAAVTLATAHNGMDLDIAGLAIFPTALTQLELDTLLAAVPSIP